MTVVALARFGPVRLASVEQGCVDLWKTEESGKRLRSVPVALGVPLKRAGKLGVALATPDGVLDEIDAASQFGEPGGAGDGVESG